MNPPPFLVMGLGNPGPEYEGSRHNLGAAALALLAQRLGIKLGRWRGPAWLARKEADGRELILARPKTFMNESGIAGAKLVRDLALSLDQVVVIYDELDLKPGRLRIRARGGTAGHNGLRSLQSHWRSQEFARIRIGIGHPGPAQDPIDYVLGRPAGEELDLLEGACARAAEAVLVIARDGVEQAMTEYNRTQPREVADVG
ncbi:MAG: aminoacyl-tRNA hydrolase [Candidatus Dormibacteria bacterium]